jgi:hypothetical protein
VGKEHFLSVDAHDEAIRTGRARVRLKVIAYVEFVVSLNKMNGLAPGSEILYGIGNVFVPREDVSIIAMVEFEEVSKDKDYVRIGTYIIQETYHELVFMIVPFIEMGIGKEDDLHGSQTPKK